MGSAAHNRGSKVIRDQIDRELAEKPKEHPSEIALRHAQRINEKLKADNERLRSRLARALHRVRKARSQRNAVTVELAEQTKQTERMRDAALVYKRARDRFYRSWIKASKLLNLLPQDLVEEVRSRGEHRT